MACNLATAVHIRVYSSFSLWTCHMQQVCIINAFSQKIDEKREYWTFTPVSKFSKFLSSQILAITVQPNLFLYINGSKKMLPHKFCFSCPQVSDRNEVVDTEYQEREVLCLISIMFATKTFQTKATIKTHKR